jgi:hypothetical protein
MIGTLVVCLPSEHEGGAFENIFPTSSIEFHLSLKASLLEGEKKHLKVPALYSSCLQQMVRLSSGV